MWQYPLRADLSRGVLPSEAQKRENPAPLLEKLEAAELKLAGLSQGYRDHLAVYSADIDRVWSLLPRGSALLELRAYQPYDFKAGNLGDLHWAAVLVSADAEEHPIVLSHLGPVSNTVQLWKRMRLATSTEEADRASAQLYNALFGSLDATLAALKTLYIAPDSFLHVVPFAQLRIPDGRYWIQRQALRRLQTGRDLLRPASKGHADQLIALGGVDFSRSGEIAHMRPAARTFAAANRRTAKALKLFKTLPASKEEAEEIAVLYRLARQAPAEVWKGGHASEQRLKALATAPRVLHLATHGFYLRATTQRIERPLVLSGLTLAGANAGLRGKIGPDGEDGILYSLEVLGLNLQGTELVTLSACDTAQGVIDYSEGVYGLVRAFKIAGVHAVLMTLWSVRDTEAKDFMIAFYTAWLQQARSDPAVALRATKLRYITHRKAALRQPRVWAPYVLVGGS